MTEITKEQLAEWVKCKPETPLPYRLKLPFTCTGAHVIESSWHIIICKMIPFCERENGEYIVTACNAFPALVVECQRLQAHLDACQEQLREVVAENTANVAECKRLQQQLAAMTEARDGLATDALCALSKAKVGTPEKGYAKEPGWLKHDIGVLARERDEARAECERLRASIQDIITSADCERCIAAVGPCVGEKCAIHRLKLLLPNPDHSGDTP